MLASGNLLGAEALDSIDWWCDTVQEIEDEYEGTDPVELDLAELLAGLLADCDLEFPEADDVFLARLERYGDPAPGPAAGVVAVLEDGRLAVCASARVVVESDGTDYVGVKDPPAGRYVAFWYVPGLLYFGKVAS